MRAGRPLRLLVALACIAGTGCTALREIPRDDYVSRVGEKPVQVVTVGGVRFELGAAHVEGDTLVGYRRREVQGPIDEFATVRLALDDVATISARRLDWYRTGLIGGLSLAAVVAAGLSRSGWGAGPGQDAPCPREPCEQ